MTMEDLLFELFSHLPAKLIYKFSNVSKDLFVKKQCRNFKDKEDSCFFIQPTLFSQVSFPINMELCYLSRTLESLHGIPPSSIEILSKKGHILASSNGLLCCKTVDEFEYPLLICNPVTKTWLPIVKPTVNYNPSHPMNIVFACNVDHGLENDYDYILMYLESNLDNWTGDSNLIKIYSPQKQVWEEVGQMRVGSRNINIGLPVYFNNAGGTIYFMSDWSNYIRRDSVYYWPYIVSYNVRNSVSGFLKIPKAARRGGFNDPSCMLGLFKFNDHTSAGETICFIKSMKLVFSVWKLTDMNKWKIILKSRVKSMGLYKDSDAKPDISGFTVMNGNVLVIATGDEIYKYALSGGDLTVKSRNVEKIEKIGWDDSGRSTVCFHSYSNTLRSCGDGAISLV